MILPGSRCQLACFYKGLDIAEMGKRIIKEKQSRTDMQVK